MGDVNLEIKLNNLDERVVKIEESGGGSGGDSYIASVSNDFNVVNKKLSLSNDVTVKLSKVDIDENVSIALEKKIDKPVSAKNGQVLTYNGTSNKWEAQYSKGVITGRTRRDITSDLTNLTKAIAEQDLEKYGYAIGDYFVGASGYYYYLADMNTNYGGYNDNAVVNTNHCGIVVDTKLTCQWLESGSVINYSSSTLHSFLTNTALPNIKSDIATLFGDWENHLIKRSELDNSIGSWGTTWNGLKDCLICAITEVQMYGARVFGADGYQTGTCCKSLELFRKYRFNEIYGNISIWLKSLFSDSFACVAYKGGDASRDSVTLSNRASGIILFH